MKIFAFIGSPREDNSLGYQFIKKLEAELKSKDSNIVFDIFRSSSLNIKFSDGGIKDFLIGETSFDDDMKTLEESMLSSDFIILVSPVYAHNVSAQMKVFIDRISYWLHIYRLVGKNGLVVSVSSDNGNDNVNTYLTEMMEYLGLYVIGAVSIMGATLNQKPKEIFDSYARVWAKRIILSEHEMIEIPYRQEENFQYQKNKYINLKHSTKEKQYWEDNGLFEVDSFNQLFIKNMENKYV